MKKLIEYYANILLKKVHFLNLINSILIRIQFHCYSFSKKYFLSTKPETLTVEPASICNLSCPECTIGNGSFIRSNGLMDIETFKLAFLPLKKWLIHCQFFFQGEPLLNPRIAEMIAIVHKAKVFTSTSTNGHLLTYDKCCELINAGLDMILISVDGTTQDTYSKYRVGGSLDSVIEGIKNLNRARKNLKKHNPYIVVQFLVFRHNEHQIGEIKQLARRWGADSVRLKTIQIEHFSQAKDLLPVNRKFSRYQVDAAGNYFIAKKYPVKCYRIRSIMVVTQNGDVVPCCYDKNGKYVYGNVHQTNPLQIWINKGIRDFRQKVWTNKIPLPICQNCPEGMKNCVIT